MGGIELRDDGLIVDREPNQLDHLAMSISDLFDEQGIEHVFVAGYVAILAGRSRATEDIDVLIERLEPGDIDALADELDSRGFWGPALPLADAAEMLTNDDPIWVAPNDQVIPHLEVKFVRDEFDRASLDGAITAQIEDAAVPIGPIELQIAYKLYLGTQTDFEDALHLYSLLEETLSEDRLEHWVKKLNVEPTNDRLRRA